MPAQLQQHLAAFSSTFDEEDSRAKHPISLELASGICKGRENKRQEWRFSFMQNRVAATVF
jgi:hypothetical protein